MQCTRAMVGTEKARVNNFFARRTILPLQLFINGLNRCRRRIGETPNRTAPSTKANCKEAPPYG